MKILKKTGIASMFIIATIATSSSLEVIYAWDPIPGIDRPFDEANYWTLTTISVPDSAPSIYTLRDLEGQGGQVYDYTRHIKSILYGDKFVDILTQVASKLGIKITKFNPLGIDGSGKMHSRLQNLLASSQSHSVQIEDSPAIFNPQYNDGASGNSTDYASAARLLSSSYEAVANSNKNLMNDNEALYQSLAEALNYSNTAEGAMQMNQAGNQIEAIENMAMMNLTNMLANKAQLENIRQQKIAADAAAAEQSIRNGSYHFYSPETDAQDRTMIENMERAAGAKRYESKGMIDFR